MSKEKANVDFVDNFVRELIKNPDRISPSLHKEIVELINQIRAYFRVETLSKYNALMSETVKILAQLPPQINIFTRLRSFLQDLLFQLSNTDFNSSIERLIWKNEKLSKTAVSIPTMLEKESLKYYKWLGDNISGDGEIVKLGCWLGASTYVIAEGLAKKNRQVARKIFAFDSFRWENWMYQFLEKDLTNRLQPRAGKSYLEDFRTFCKDYNSSIMPRESYLYIDNEKRRLQPFTWDGKPIKIYSYGLSGDYAYVKKAWEIYSPGFLPDETIIIFDEYGNLQAEGLRRFCAERSDMLRPLHKPASALKTFLFTSGAKERTYR